MDPGPELRAAHLTALRDEPSRTVAAPHGGTPPPDGTAVPHGDITPHGRNPGPPDGGTALPGDIAPHGGNPANQPPDTTALPGGISSVDRKPVAQGDSSLPDGNTAPWTRRSSPGPRGNLPARL